MSPRTAESCLRWLLLIPGGLTCSAFLAVAMPTSWMEAGAEWAGVGPFEDSTLMQYVVRSLSLLYALFGVLTVHLGLNVRRYRELIVFVGRLTVVLGVALTGIDFAIGMPASWTWGEGPPTVLVGIAIVILARRVPPADQSNSSR